MKLIKLFLLTLFIGNNAIGQVSQQDIKHFGDNLNIRRRDKVGMNPHAVGFFQVPFGEYDYKGIYAVSSKFMSLVYPNENPVLVEGMFTTIAMDKVVFDKFIFQIFKYCKNEKKNIVGIIYAFCDNEELASQIYTQYQKEYYTKLSKIEKTQEKEVEAEDANLKTFDIPINNGNENLTYKDKQVISLVLTAIGVQFRNFDEYGIDEETIFKIEITGDEIKIKSKYLDGYMVDEYVVDSIQIDNQKIKFSLKSLEKVKRNSYLNPAKVEYYLSLYWYEQAKSYGVEFNSIDKKESKIFLNKVSVDKINVSKNSSSKTANSNSESEFNYQVIVDKSFFYDSPDNSNIRKAYLVKGEKIRRVKEENGYIYTEFQNAQGKVTIGWIKLETLKKE